MDGPGPAPNADISMDELQLAARNHSMPLEALRYDITPVGLHYLLTHWDIPEIDVTTWRLSVGGAVRKPLALGLDDLTALPWITERLTLECAGNGRAHFSPRPISQPWLYEAVGNAEWTGTPLRGLLESAEPLDDSLEVVFTGVDRGVQGGIEQHYERSLPVAEAMRDDVLVAHRMNGEPLTPQHGYPVRLVIPGWYGMAHVKWLRSITVIDQRFRGYQQEPAYHLTPSEDIPGMPVTRVLPRSLMVPPGIPEFITRHRYVAPGPCDLMGRAWSGHGSITRVEVSADGGARWADAELGTADSEFGWRLWRYRWQAEEGEHELCCRATDASGRVQPLVINWNAQGICNNEVHPVRVIVGAGVVPVQPAADPDGGLR